MKKIFRAVSETIVEKDFISNDVVPQGWYDSVSAAFAAFKETDHGLQRQGQTPTEEVIPDFLKPAEEPKRRGRPRKE